MGSRHLLLIICFDKAITKQVNQVRRAMFAMIIKACRLRLSVDIQYELFDQLILYQSSCMEVSCGVPIILNKSKCFMKNS